MDTGNKLRVGFVGSGFIARIHAQAMQELDEAEPVAWSAGHLEHAANAAGEFGGQAVSAEELLASPEIEVVVISTPTPLHASQTIRALEHGKHVFCEKPLARNDEQAAAILEAARHSQGRLFVGHTLRFFANYARARELLRAGAIGTLQNAICRRLNPLSAAGSWFWEYDQSGGCILDLMIHDFDFLNWCVGKPTRVEVETEPGKDPRGMLHAMAHLYFESGAKAQVEGSWRHDCFERSLVLEGDRGRLAIDPTDEVLHLEDDRGSHTVPVSGRDPYVEQMSHFFHCLRTGSRFCVTPEEARQALAVSLAGLKKIEKQRGTANTG